MGGSATGNISGPTDISQRFFNTLGDVDRIVTADAKQKSTMPSAALPLSPDYQARPQPSPQQQPYQPSPQATSTPYQPQVQPQMPQPQQPTWQQAPEWQSYQTQMTDLQNQLNSSPLMQQLQQLQGKMQNYQQQHAQPPQYQQPQYGGYNRGYGGYGGYNRGYGSGIAGLMGGFQFKKGGKV